MHVKHSFGGNLNMSAISTSTSTATAQDQICIAANRLSKSAIDNLWNEHVTKASNIFTKFAGLFSYLWNRSTAAAQDAPAVKATIEEYNKATAALVKAVAHRDLTKKEAKRIQIAPLKYSDPKEQKQAANYKRAAEVAEADFYKVFKKRCQQLNVNTNDREFGIYTEAAANQVKKYSASAQLSDYYFDNLDPTTLGSLHTKIETVIEGFSQKIYYEMIDGYANQPIESFTVESFKQKAADIRGFYPMNQIVDIEATLRQKLKIQHDQEFNRLAQEYLNPNADNAKIDEIKVQLRTAHEAERTAIDAELLELRGTNNWNGTINAANNTLIQARAALDAAQLAFVNLYNTTYPSHGPQSTIDALLALDFAAAPVALVNAKADLIARNNECIAADQAKQALIARLTELATTFDGNGNILTGTHAEVNAKLEETQLGRVARDEATRLGSFYRELNMDVNERNKQARFNRMQQLAMV